jgi:hypothetical protein
MRPSPLPVVAASDDGDHEVHASLVNLTSSSRDALLQSVAMTVISAKLVNVFDGQTYEECQIKRAMLMRVIVMAALTRR